jgi:two-component system, OmpR family, phosphate regulon sensor histidine kinase PhoR
VTFVRRLVLASIFILVCAVGILFWAAERSLRVDLEEDIAQALEIEARLIRETLPADSQQWQAAVHRLAIESSHRITLISRDGTVRADSDFPLGPLPPLQNHASRPEVRAALEGRRGVASRRSETVGRMFLYVAVPGGPGVVVRVAAGLDQVNETVRQAQRAVAGAALLAILVGSALALLAGRAITGPLTEIGSAAREIAAGGAPRFSRSGLPDIDALVQTMRDMHQQLGERFDQLRRERAETAALVESMVEGVIAADASGRIVTANTAARRMLGYKFDERLPNFAELFRVKGAREVVDQTMNGTVVQGREVEMDDRTLLMNARPLPAGGAVLVLHDLTDLRRLESMRRDFVANVSHELKTPLTSISGYAETLLSDTPDPETTHGFLQIILVNARRMQRLVDDLLDLARLEAGRWQPEPEPVQVAELFQDTWNAFRDAPSGSAIEFSLDVGAGASEIVADPDAVQQILTNLLENSLRYTPPGGRIICRSVVADDGIELSVSDSGSGIVPEHLPRIFERFYRADPSRSREEGGTGLGLAIVKHLVEAHGGRVSAKSERGVGTTITCWFPNAPVAAHPV